MRGSTSKARKSRTKSGTGLVEAAASVVLLLPLFLFLLNVIAEVVEAYTIKASLTQACNRAVRDLTVLYWQNPQIATSRSLQDSLVFDKVRIKNIVNNSQQFANPTFDLNANPPVVTLAVSYQSGKYGLPVFPNPDVLRLGPNFVITAQHTHALE